MIYFSNDSILIKKEWNEIENEEVEEEEREEKEVERGTETGGRMRSTDIILKNQLLI